MINRWVVDFKFSRSRRAPLRFESLQCLFSMVFRPHGQPKRVRSGQRVSTFFFFCFRSRWPLGTDRKPRTLVSASRKTVFNSFESKRAVVAIPMSSTPIVISAESRPFRWGKVFETIRRRRFEPCIEIVHFFFFPVPTCTVGSRPNVLESQNSPDPVAAYFRAGIFFRRISFFRDGKNSAIIVRDSGVFPFSVSGLSTASPKYAKCERRARRLARIPRVYYKSWPPSMVGAQVTAAVRETSIFVTRAVGRGDEFGGDRKKSERKPLGSSRGPRSTAIEGVGGDGGGEQTARLWASVREFFHHITKKKKIKKSSSRPSVSSVKPSLGKSMVVFYSVKLSKFFFFYWAND